MLRHDVNQIVTKRVPRHSQWNVKVQSVECDFYPSKMSDKPTVKPKDQPVKPPKAPHEALPSVVGRHDNVGGHYYEPVRPPVNYQFSGSERKEEGAIPGGRVAPQLVTVRSKKHRIFVPFNKQYTPIMASIPMHPVKVNSDDKSYVETYSVPKRHYRFWPPVAGSQDVPKDKKGKDSWFASGKLEPLDKDPQPLPTPKKAPKAGTAKPSSKKPLAASGGKVPSPAPGKKSHQETLSKIAAKQPNAETEKKTQPPKGPSTPSTGSKGPPYQGPGVSKVPSGIKGPSNYYGKGGISGPSIPSGSAKPSSAGSGKPTSAGSGGAGKPGTGAGKPGTDANKPGTGAPTKKGDDKSKPGSKTNVRIETPSKDNLSKPSPGGSDVDRRKFPLAGHQAPPYHPYSPSYRGQQPKGNVSKPPTGASKLPVVSKGPFGTKGTPDRGQFGTKGTPDKGPLRITATRLPDRPYTASGTKAPPPKGKNTTIFIPSSAGPKSPTEGSSAGSKSPTEGSSSGSSEPSEQPKKGTGTTIVLKIPSPVSSGSSQGSPPVANKQPQSGGKGSTVFVVPPMNSPSSGSSQGSPNHMTINVNVKVDGPEDRSSGSKHGDDDDDDDDDDGEEGQFLPSEPTRSRPRRPGTGNNRIAGPSIPTGPIVGRGAPPFKSGRSPASSGSPQSPRGTGHNHIIGPSIPSGPVVGKGSPPHHSRRSPASSGSPQSPPRRPQTRQGGKNIVINLPTAPSTPGSGRPLTRSQARAAGGRPNESQLPPEAVVTTRRFVRRRRTVRRYTIGDGKSGQGSPSLQ